MECVTHLCATLTLTVTAPYRYTGDCKNCSNHWVSFELLYGLGWA